MSSKKHDVPDTLLDSLLADYQKPEDLITDPALRRMADHYALRAHLVQDAARNESGRGVGLLSRNGLARCGMVVQVAPEKNPAGQTSDGKSVEPVPAGNQCHD